MQDQGELVLRQFWQQRIVRAGAREDQPVHLLLADQAGVGFVAGHVLGHLQDQQIAPAVNRGRDPLQERGKKGIGRQALLAFTQHQSDPLGLAARQRAGRGSGVIVQFPCGLEHALARLLCDLDAGNIVEDK